MSSSELMVYKANELVVSRYDLTENETKILLYALGKLNPTMQGLSEKDRTVIIPYQEYAEYMNISDSVAWNNLNNGLSGIMSKSIEIVNPDPTFPIEKRIFQWADRADFNRQTQSVEIEFSKYIQPYLFNLEEFIKYKLSNVKSLNNRYSVRFYEILLKGIGGKYISKKTVEIELSVLKNLLKLDNNYPIFKSFNRRVLKVVIDDINANSDLKVSVKTQGRPVNNLIFTVEKVKQIDLVNEIEKEEQKNSSSMMNFEKTEQQKIDLLRINKTKIILEYQEKSKLSLTKKELSLLQNMQNHFFENGDFKLKGKITEKTINFFDEVLNKYLPRLPNRKKSIEK
ncbi:replication initiation protein [Pasteurella multocida]|uniref:replication initiation protein n=1 Tax=Pasteurella multocida TaxID=747 RepID=UPI000CE8EB63|nr:replication initiation protein [Pasteurella multocida]PPE94942.1 replication initiation protein [Pasteurella multocida]PPE95035.1 replication initiation protein [Pasteurella multocida]